MNPEDLSLYHNNSLTQSLQYQWKINLRAFSKSSSIIYIRIIRYRELSLNHCSPDESRVTRQSCRLSWWYPSNTWNRKAWSQKSVWNLQRILSLWLQVWNCYETRTLSAWTPAWSSHQRSMLTVNRLCLNRSSAWSLWRTVCPAIANWPVGPVENAWNPGIPWVFLDRIEIRWRASGQDWTQAGS